MNSTERSAVLDDVQRLFGLTDAELARILVDPEQLLAIADVLAAAESSISRSSSPRLTASCVPCSRVKRPDNAFSGQGTEMP